MSATHITDIAIENFRSFEKLELAGLASVNLIVGKNNAGKTSLLEAFALAADPFLFENLPGLLHGYAGIRDPNTIYATPFREHRFERWVIRDGTEAGRATLRVTGEVLKSGLIIERRTAYNSNQEYQGDPEALRKLEVWRSKSIRVRQEAPILPLRVKILSVLPAPSHIVVRNVGNALRKRKGEELIHAVLQKVDPRIQRVRVDPIDEGNIVAVDIGLSEMIPLSQVGHGLERLINMMAELIGGNAQVCIVDEIENGIHYTAFKDVWRGVAEISRMTGVQVFATTHSRECLEAAHEVFFDEDPRQEKDFAVIQLMRVKGHVVGKVLNEARVDAALENDIELR